MDVAQLAPATAPCVPSPPATLIERCQRGDSDAWEKMYQEHNEQLLQRIRQLLGSRARDENLVEEIAAKVWFSLLDKHARLLKRYRQNGGHRFGAYLVGIARNELMNYLRAERRRQRREVIHVFLEATAKDARHGSDHERLADWSEFLAALTPSERSFLKRCLQRGNGKEMSAANRWQLGHRLRRKIRVYFSVE